MSPPRVFIHVQHLLGIGHLKRAMTLARALVAEELEVTVASGGPAIPGLGLEGGRFVQLPAARALDASFKQLVDETGQAIDEAWKERRREALLAAWHEADSDVLLVELFPFGRRQMRFELMPLLEAAHAAARRPIIVSSVRDLLAGGQRNPERQDAMLEVFERHFDRVLVHADPRFITFDRTFRHAAGIANRLHYTGFIVARAPIPRPRDQTGAGEVLVSAGGGAVGAPLLETAIRARTLTSLAGNTWRVLAGASADPAALASLRALAKEHGEGHVVVEQARSDFTSLLANCVVSVSQAGYNTVMEILQAGARAVVVPFAGGNETEQTQRAELLALRGSLEVVGEHLLTPESLAAAVERAARKPRLGVAAVDLDGASRSAELIAGWARER